MLRRHIQTRTALHLSTLVRGPSASTVVSSTCHNVGIQYQYPPSLVVVQISSSFILESKRFHGAYVSRHNVSLNVSPQIINDYCQSHGLQVKSNATHVMIRECPFCTKPTRGQLSNLYKLYIESSTGAYFCHRCGASGSWYDFKAKMNHHGGHSIHASSTSSSSFVVTTPTIMGGNSLNAGNKYGSRFGGNYNNNTSGGGANAAGRMIGNHSNNHESMTTSLRSVSEPPLPLPPSRLSAIYSTRLLDDDNTCLNYLMQTRGLTRATLRKFGVGRATYKFAADHGYVDAECITFPWIIKESELVQQEALRGVTCSVTSMPLPPNVVVNATDETKSQEADTVTAEANSTTSTNTTDNNNNNNNNRSNKNDPFITRRIKARAVSQKAWQRLDPPGGGWGLFGWHTIPDDATEIVLTEGEYDAMAVTQATGRHAVSLPNGCRSLPVPVLPLLERFSKIYLWMDNDVPGQEGSETFAKKLGLNRCFIVQCRDAKDANEALLKGLDLDSYIQQATVVPHDRLLTFADLRSEVLHELLEPDLYKGAPIPSLPTFTKLIKGFRRGELTVLTGPTGSGKVSTTSLPTHQNVTM